MFDFVNGGDGSMASDISVCLHFCARLHGRRRHGYLSVRHHGAFVDGGDDDMVIFLRDVMVCFLCSASRPAAMDGVDSRVESRQGGHSAPLW
jgi:hypothetical protein